MDSVSGLPPVPLELREPLHPTQMLGRGWQSFTAYPWMSLGALVVLFAIVCVGSWIPFVNLLFALLLEPALVAGGAWFILRAVRGEKPPIESLFDGFRRWPSVTGAVLLIYLGVFVCEVPLFVIAFATAGIVASWNPGDIARQFSPAMIIGPLGLSALVLIPLMVWWSVRTCCVMFAVMEPDSAGAMDAFRRSWAMTRGSVWRLVGLALLGMVTAIVGFIALCIGILPAALTVYYAFAHAYEQLRHRAGAPAAPAPVPMP